MTNRQLFLSCQKKYCPFQELIFYEIFFFLSPSIKEKTTFISHIDDGIDFSVRKMYRLLDQYFFYQKPLAHIIGYTKFLGLNLVIKPRVLCPREITEFMTSDFIASFKKTSSRKIYDLCAGSGCIGLSIKYHCPQHEVFLVEKFNRPWKNLSLNQKNLAIDCHLIHQDVFSFLPSIAWSKETIIISNPPYISWAKKKQLAKLTKYEHKFSLFANDNGLFFYQKYFSILDKNIFDQCWLEFGYDQKEGLIDLLKSFKTLNLIKIDQQNNYLVISKIN